MEGPHKSQVTFKDPEFADALEKAWIGSLPFPEAIACIAHVPKVTTLRCNSLRENPKVALEKIAALFPAPKFSVVLHPALWDLIEVRKTTAKAEEGKLKEYPQKLLVDERCACYVLRGASIFCKGVMASTHFSVGDWVSVYHTSRSFTTGAVITEESVKTMKDELRFLGNGMAKMSRKEALIAKSGVAIDMRELADDSAFPFSFEQLLDQQLFYPQNIGSALVAHLLDPQPGELILDICAAPGGKTTHVALLAKNKANIIATDKSAERIAMMEKACQDQGVTCVRCFKADAKDMLRKNKTLKNAKETVELKEDMFDKVVLDPPCSSLGVKPFLGHVSGTLSESNHITFLQREILENASRLVKKGGLISYSTCTITPWENEEAVKYAITKLGLKLVHPKIVIAPPVKSTVLTQEETECVQRIELSSDYNGFFVALLTK